MNSEEVRNKLLTAIHNRLAEISKFLEVGIALFAKLDTYDLETLKDNCKKLGIETVTWSDNFRLSQDDDYAVGFSSAMGLFHEFWDRQQQKEVCSPLGEYDERIMPVNEETGYFLTDDEVVLRQKQKESE